MGNWDRGRGRCHRSTEQRHRALDMEENEELGQGPWTLSLEKLIMDQLVTSYTDIIVLIA